MMGKIVVNLSLDNGRKPLPSPVKCRATVDTGADFLTLPLAWKERFGAFPFSRNVVAHTASHIVSGEVCGPVAVKIAGFETIAAEALFIPMTPAANGKYEPLLGHVPLESCGAVVDMKNRKLKSAMYVSAKSAGVTRGGDRKALEAEISRNYDAFSKMKFAPDQKGKIALLRGGELVEILDSRADAHKFAKLMFDGAGHYSVQEIDAAPFYSPRLQSAAAA